MSDVRECSACSEMKPPAEFRGKNQRCKECDVNWSEYHKRIDEFLDAARPSRTPFDDREWREKAYDWARNHMPNETNLIRHRAQQVVDQREVRATRRGNDLVRSWFKGQAPLFFSDIGATPIKVGADHIRLDAASVTDGRLFVREQRDAADQHHRQWLLTCDAVTELTDMATQAGYMTIAQLGDLPPRLADQSRAA